MTNLTYREDAAANRLARATGPPGTVRRVARLTPIGAAVTAAGLARRAADARGLAESLLARGVRAVAVTVVDNAGIARVKTVPVTGLDQATQWGVGLSPVFAVATVDDSFTTSTTVGGPTGDLRLMPDPAALRVVAVQPGWAWTPADQYTQDGQVFSCCQRSFARRMTDLAAMAGLEVRVGSEIEWFLGRDDHGTPAPAHSGPGYGLAALASLAEYALELIAGLGESGIRVGQFHPEYAPGQLEISLPPAGRSRPPT
jgi:glutamine synthetase